MTVHTLCTTKAETSGADDGATTKRSVVGFFDGDEVVAFEHQVVTAYYWPVDEFSARLHRAGFTEIERQRRPGAATPGHRPHAAIAAIAT